MTAIGEKGPAERLFGDPGNDVPYLRRVKQVYTYAAEHGFVPFRKDFAHLLFRQGDVESAVMGELGGIAQLIVQRRPYLEGFRGHRYQRWLVNPFADHPAISPGGLAPDGSLLDHYNVLARSGQEIGRA